MTLSLFWSRYTLELQGMHMRDVDEQYQYVIARERWNWFLAKIPEQIQIQILRGHNHGADSWSCHKWLEHMLAWVQENKPPAVSSAITERFTIMDKKPVEELEKQAAHSLAPEELKTFQDAGYFQAIPPVVQG